MSRVLCFIAFCLDTCPTAQDRFQAYLDYFRMTLPAGWLFMVEVCIFAGIRSNYDIL
jgi:hypothetical protein